MGRNGKLNSLRFLLISLLGAAALLLTPRIGLEAAAAGEAEGGLSLTVTEVTASKVEGPEFYDPRLGRAIAQLKGAELAYNSFTLGGVSTRRLQPGSTATIPLAQGRQMAVKLQPTSPQRPQYAPLDISVKGALHAQTFLKSGGTVLFHLPGGGEPPTGAILILQLKGVVPPAPSPATE